MCGIEKAGFEKNKVAMKKAIQMDVMLHAYMFMQSGIPVIYSGDEIGQVNDYSYKLDPHKSAGFPLHSQRCDELGTGGKK